MSETEAEIVLLKNKNKPYYDSSALTGLVPKLCFKTEKKSNTIYL